MNKIVVIQILQYISYSAFKFDLTINCRYSWSEHLFFLWYYDDSLNNACFFSKRNVYLHFKISTHTLIEIFLKQLNLLSQWTFSWRNSRYNLRTFLCVYEYFIYFLIFIHTLKKVVIWPIQAAIHFVHNFINNKFWV